MSTATIIAIVVVAIVLLVLTAIVSRTVRLKRLAGRRQEAGELRQEARTRTIQAESARASADEQAARAKRAQAEAEERAAQARQDSVVAQQRKVEAERETEIARAHHDRARAVDPDVSDTGEDEALAVDRGSRESNSKEIDNASSSYERPDLGRQ